METKQQLRQSIINLATGVDVIGRLRHQLQPFLAKQAINHPYLFTQIQQPAALLDLEGIVELETIVLDPQDRVFKSLNDLINTLESIRLVALDNLNDKQAATLVADLICCYVKFRERFCKKPLKRQQLSQLPVCMYAVGLGEEFYYLPDWMGRQINPIINKKNSLNYVTQIGDHFYKVFLEQAEAKEVIDATYENAVYSLTNKLFGEGIAPTELLLITISKVGTYCVSVSAGVKGHNLQDIILKDPDRITDIQLSSFSAHFLLTNIVVFTDGKFDAYLIDQNSNLVSVDNDRAFDSLIGKKIEDGMDVFYNNIISCLFLLPQMDKPLDPDVRKKFLNYNARQLIQEWLNDLLIKNKDYQQYVIYLKPEYVKRLHLPLKFLPATVFEIFQRIKVLQETINKDSSVTHREIIKTLHPLVLDCYCYIESYAKEKAAVERQNPLILTLSTLNQRNAFVNLEKKGFQSTGSLEPYLNYANSWITEDRTESLEEACDTFDAFLYKKLDEINTQPLDDLLEDAHQLLNYRLQRVDKTPSEHINAIQQICHLWVNKFSEKRQLSQDQKISFYLRVAKTHHKHKFYENALEYYTYALILNDQKHASYVDILNEIEVHLTRTYCQEADIALIADYKPRWHSNFITLRTDIREPFFEKFKETYHKPRDFIKAQKYFTHQIKEFLVGIFLHIQTYIGNPPCAYSFLGIGSIVRNALCPYSDLDCALMVESEIHRTHPYFRTLLKLFELQINLLGERKGGVNPGGLRIDSGDFTPEKPGEPPKHLNTPQGFLDLYNPETIEIKSAEAHSLHRPVIIYAVNALGKRLNENEEQLLNKYTEMLLAKFSIVHKELAARYFIYHQSMFYQEISIIQRDISQNDPSNIKDSYLTLLLLWCTDIALYQGIYLLDPMDILLQLAKQGCITFEQAEDAQMAIATLQQIRCELHFASQWQNDLLPTNQKVMLLAGIVSNVLQPFYSAILTLFGPNLSMITEYNTKPHEYSFAEPTIDAWKQTLQSFLTPDTPLMQQKCLTDFPELPLVRLTHRPLNIGHLKLQKTSLLYAAQVEQLNIDKNTGYFTNKNRNTEESLRPVMSIKRDAKGDGEIKIYLKSHPEFPGIQVSVDNFTKRLTGYSAQTELVRFSVNFPGREVSYPVLISEPKGKTLQTILVEDRHLNSVEDNLDPYFFALKVFVTLLIYPEDDKPDNISVQEFINKDGKKVCRLVSFDNDHAFANPMIGDKVELKSMVFCFKQMQLPLNKEAVQDFLQITNNPKLLLNSWLNDLVALTAYYQGYDKNLSLFTPEEITRHTQSKKTYSYCPIIFEPLDVSKLFQRLLRMRSALETVQKVDPSIKTPFDLLACMEPRLASCYEKAFTDHNEPAARFNALDTCYNKIVEPTTKIVQFQSVYNMRERPFRSLTRPAAQKRDLAAAITADQTFGPKEAIAELERASSQYASITTYRQEWLDGNFEKLIKLKTEDMFLIIESIIRQIDFSQFTADDAAQLEFFSLLVGIDFRELTIRNSAVLTNGLLEAILGKSPNCQNLNLAGCTGLTSGLPNDVVRIINNACPQLERLDLSRTSITLINSTTGRRLLFPSLKRLYIRNAPEINRIFINAPKLIHLDVSNNTMLANMRFGKMKHLETAVFDGCAKLNLDAIENLFENFIQEIMLQVQGCPNISLGKVAGWNKLLAEHRKYEDRLSNADQEASLEFQQILNDKRQQKCRLNFLLETASHLYKINEWQKIKQLDFSYCAVLDDKILEKFLALSKNLEILNLSYCPNISQQSWRTIGKYCRKIKTISIKGNLQIKELKFNAQQSSTYDQLVVLDVTDCSELVTIDFTSDRVCLKSRGAKKLILEQPALQQLAMRWYLAGKEYQEYHQNDVALLCYREACDFDSKYIYPMGTMKANFAQEAAQLSATMPQMLPSALAASQALLYDQLGLLNNNFPSQLNNGNKYAIKANVAFQELINHIKANDCSIDSLVIDCGYYSNEQLKFLADALAVNHTVWLVKLIHAHGSLSSLLPDGAYQLLDIIRRRHILLSKMSEVDMPLAREVGFKIYDDLWKINHIVHKKNQYGFTRDKEFESNSFKGRPFVVDFSNSIPSEENLNQIITYLLSKHSYMSTVSWTPYDHSSVSFPEELFSKVNSDLYNWGIIPDISPAVIVSKKVFIFEKKIYRVSSSDMSKICAALIERNCIAANIFLAAAAAGNIKKVKYALEKLEVNIHVTQEMALGGETEFALGNTALHFSAYFGQTATVAYLLSMGANQYLRNQSYCTPLDLARASGHADVVDLLKKEENFNFLPEGLNFNELKKYALTFHEYISIEMAKSSSSRNDQYALLSKEIPVRPTGLLVREFNFELSYYALLFITVDEMIKKSDILHNQGGNSDLTVNMKDPQWNSDAWTLLMARRLERIHVKRSSDQSIGHIFNVELGDYARLVSEKIVLNEAADKLWQTPAYKLARQMRLHCFKYDKPLLSIAIPANKIQPLIPPVIEKLPSKEQPAISAANTALP